MRRPRHAREDLPDDAEHIGLGGVQEEVVAFDHAERERPPGVLAPPFELGRQHRIVVRASERGERSIDRLSGHMTVGPEELVLSASKNSISKPYIR